MSAKYITLSVIMLCQLGCSGGGTTTADPPTAEQQSNSNKLMLTQFVQDARTNPGNAANAIVGIVESLEASKDTLGSSADQIIASAKKLQSLYGSSAKKNEIEAELKNLESLANAM